MEILYFTVMSQSSAVKMWQSYGARQGLCAEWGSSSFHHRYSNFWQLGHVHCRDGESSCLSGCVLVTRCMRSSCWQLVVRSGDAKVQTTCPLSNSGIDIVERISGIFLVIGNHKKKPKRECFIRLLLYERTKLVTCVSVHWRQGVEMFFFYWIWQIMEIVMLYTSKTITPRRIRFCPL